MKRITRAALHLDTLLLGLVASTLIATAIKLLLTGERLILGPDQTIAAGTVLLMGALLGSAVAAPLILRRQPRLGNALSLGLLAIFIAALVSAAR